MSHGIPVTLCLVTFFDLAWALGFSSMTLLLKQYLPETYKSFLGDFNLFAFLTDSMTYSLTDSMTQSMKTVFLTFDLTLT